MRPWIEKLAKISKEKGIFNHFHIIINDLEWDIDYYMRMDVKQNRYLYIENFLNDNNYQTSQFKLYEDEVALLSETITYCENKTKDDILNKIENLE